MKYLVMECHPGYAVVLSEDGRFLKTANLRYEVGQTVSDIIEVSLPQPQEQPVKTNNRRWISSFGAMAACLALMVTSIFFYGLMPYASVYMTINPEVRIDVNRRDTVIDVVGMNTDGVQLLENYDPGKKDLDTVMDELLDLAIDMGYLHEGGKITLSLDGDETWVVTHEAHLNTHLNDYLTDRVTVTIDIEQKQPEQPTFTAPTGMIVIPVGPDSYDDSDYGDDDESDYAPADDEDSGYGQSDYDEDDAQSDYAEPDNSESDGDSVYEADSDYGQSDYTNEEDAAVSDYEEPDDEEQTDYYDSDDTDEDSSDYDGSDEAISDYEEADSQYDEE